VKAPDPENASKRQFRGDFCNYVSLLLGGGLVGRQVAVADTWTENHNFAGVRNVSRFLKFK
jgi:hypothetical protein